MHCTRKGNTSPDRISSYLIYLQADDGEYPEDAPRSSWVLHLPSSGFWSTPTNISSTHAGCGKKSNECTKKRKCWLFLAEIVKQYRLGFLFHLIFLLLYFILCPKFVHFYCFIVYFFSASCEISKYIFVFFYETGESWVVLRITRVHTCEINMRNREIIPNGRFDLRFKNYAYERKIVVHLYYNKSFISSYDLFDITVILLYYHNRKCASVRKLLSNCFIFYKTSFLWIITPDIWKRLLL